MAENPYAVGGLAIFLTIVAMRRAFIAGAYWKPWLYPWLQADWADRYVRPTHREGDEQDG